MQCPLQTEPLGLILIPSIQLPERDHQMCCLLGVLPEGHNTPAHLQTFYFPSLKRWQILPSFFFSFSTFCSLCKVDRAAVGSSSAVVVDYVHWLHSGHTGSNLTLFPFDFLKDTGSATAWRHSIVPSWDDPVATPEIACFIPPPKHRQVWEPRYVGQPCDREAPIHSSSASCMVFISSEACTPALSSPHSGFCFTQ